MRPYVPACVRSHSNTNISATSQLIEIKCYLKHHWCDGKVELGFGPDRIRELWFPMQHIAPIDSQSGNKNIF